MKLPSAALLSLLLASATALDAGRHPGNGISIGIEYMLLDNDNQINTQVSTFAEMEIDGIKALAEKFEWGKMQTGPTADIDFTVLDKFVLQAQNKGFTTLTIALKSHSNWASQHLGWFGQKSAAPKPEYEHLYSEWIRAVVERYDFDGVDDMDGLRWSVNYIEIGSELSTYEPEPIDDYIHMLSIAYSAAHQASDTVLVAHAAFLITPVDLNVANPSDLAEYETAWANTVVHDDTHGIYSQRAVMDHPELFDVINVHNLGYPYEIEHIKQWLDTETADRGYAGTKDIIISDTIPTSYIAWGPADTCTGSPQGILLLPAETQSDRCDLASFFTQLIAADPATLEWTRAFVAADHVQRTVIAAEQGFKMINLSFTTDLWWLKLPGMHAGAGISAWAGAIKINLWGGLQQKYPLFYAIKQLMGHLAGYDNIQRLDLQDDQVRVYEVTKNGQSLWIGWRDPQSVLLPDDGTPTTQVQIWTASTGASVEEVITGAGQTTPVVTYLTATQQGVVTLDLTHSPVYVVAVV